MSFSKHLRSSLLFASLAVFAGSASAQTSSENASALNLSGSIESTLRLDISDTAINFGDVDGLYENSAGTGFTGAADGTTGAIYFKTAAVSLTPHWSGFGASPTVDVKLLGGGTHSALIRESGTGTAAALKIATVDDVTATSLSVSATNGSAISRYVGFYVPRNSTATTISASLTYSLEVIPD